MSHEANTQLLERAREIAEIYTGTPLQDAILNNIEWGNLERVAQLVKETEDYWLADVFTNVQPLTDDQLDAMGKDQEQTDVY